jgi:hypothetical protein
MAQEILVVASHTFHEIPIHIPQHSSAALLDSRDAVNVSGSSNMKLAILKTWKLMSRHHANTNLMPWKLTHLLLHYQLRIFNHLCHPQLFFPLHEGNMLNQTPAMMQTE